MAVVSAGITVALSIVVASSGSVQIWTIPSSISAPNGGASTPPKIGPQSPVPSDRIALPSWLIALLPYLAVLFIVLIVIALASMRVAWPFPQFGWRRSRWRLRQQITALPEVKQRQLTVDMDAALAALGAGNPRNAIVACWMQLESDAAKVGLERMTAETPTEYVERVVGVSSIDPAPIKELAALYREARFSVHQLGDHDRSRAVSALHRVATTLNRHHEVAV